MKIALNPIRNWTVDKCFTLCTRCKLSRCLHNLWMLSTSSSSFFSANDGISRCLFYDSYKTENRIRNDLIFCSFLRIFIEF